MDERVPPRGYDAHYARFDTPLARRLRSAAYGQDIGQHSWASAAELAEDGERLLLSPASLLLDLGCGPGGPATYLAGAFGCRAVGVDRSVPAISSARARVAALALAGRVDFAVGDLDDPLTFAGARFAAVLAVDAVLHVRDRETTFAEVRRVLVPGGRFLFTDAGVVTGALSHEEIERRSINGRTRLVPPGVNERALARAGLRLLDDVERTAGLVARARGRLTAMREVRAELERVEGAARFAEQTLYLETVVELAERGALSRFMYLAERAG